MKKILLIISMFLFSNFLNAEIIKNIIIEGNERISDETIKVYGEVKLNDNIDEIKINEIIKNLYSTNFFKDINVSLRNQTLFINLEEYPVINEIIIICALDKPPPSLFSSILIYFILIYFTLKITFYFYNL